VRPNVFAEGIDFGSFDPKIFLEATVNGGTVVSLRKGENIFSRGDDARFIVQVRKGSVELITPDGNKTFISTFGKGDFLGEECLAGARRRNGTAYAKTPAVLWVVQKKDFLRLLRQEPELSHHFIAYLLARSIRIEKRLIDVVRRSRARTRPGDARASGSSRRKVSPPHLLPV
jgi:CRP-like cAMP-binding protein